VTERDLVMIEKALEQGRQHSEQMVRRLLAVAVEEYQPQSPSTRFAVEHIIKAVACYDATQARFLDSLLAEATK